MTLRYQPQHIKHIKNNNSIITTSLTKQQEQKNNNNNIKDMRREQHIKHIKITKCWFLILGLMVESLIRILVLMNLHHLEVINAPPVDEDILVKAQIDDSSGDDDVVATAEIMTRK